MDIQIKETEQCKLKINYSVGQDVISKKRSEVEVLFKDGQVPGYRKGKQTQEATRIHYKDQIKATLERALAEDAYHNTLFEKNLRPFGQPQYHHFMILDGKFSCEFDMAVKPDFELAQYKPLQIPKPHEEINVPDLTEKMLQELRIKFGDVSPYIETDTVQLTDNVIVDYVGEIDGKKIDGLSASGEMFTVGSNDMPSFDDHILNLSIGQSTEFDVTIPEDGLPSLIGKTIHFKITVNMGSKTVPHALDDELAKKLGKDTLQELRDLVTSAAQGKVSQLNKTNLNQTISHHLIDSNTISVPNWLSISEAKYLAHNSKLNWDTMQDVDKEKYLDMAEKNVKLSLVLDRIRESEPEAQLSDIEIANIVKQNLSKLNNTNKTYQQLIEEMSKSGHLQILMTRLKDEFVLDFIAKSAVLTD